MSGISPEQVQDLETFRQFRDQQFRQFLSDPSIVQITEGSRIKERLGRYLFGPGEEEEYRIWCYAPEVFVNFAEYPADKLPLPVCQVLELSAPAGLIRLAGHLRISFGIPRVQLSVNRRAIGQDDPSFDCSLDLEDELLADPGYWMIDSAPELTKQRTNDELLNFKTMSPAQIADNLSGRISWVSRVQAIGAEYQSLATILADPAEAFTVHCNQAALDRYTSP